MINKDNRFNHVKHIVFVPPTGHRFDFFVASKYRTYEIIKFTIMNSGAKFLSSGWVYISRNGVDVKLVTYKHFDGPNSGEIYTAIDKVYLANGDTMGFEVTTYGTGSEITVMFDYIEYTP